MSHALIYHYWNDRDDVPVWRDMCNPVVVSIATARFHHPDVPIYVLDVSERPNDWGEYPTLLGFDVVRQTPSIPVPFRGPGPRDDDLNINRSTYKYCSSVFDVVGLGYRVPQDRIVFADSDLFFLKPNLPEPGDRLNCRPGYVGFYYYDKYASRRFLDLWRRCIVRGLLDREYRQRVAVHYRIPNFFNQEAAFIYLCHAVGAIDRHVRFLPPVEHCFEPDHPAKDLSMFHFTGHFFGNTDRGKAGFMIREVYEPMRVLLGGHRLRDMFGMPSEWGGRFGIGERRALTNGALGPGNLPAIVFGKGTPQGGILG